MCCTTKNLIYILFCNNCNKFYVGETSMALNLRINLHRNHITNNNYGHLPVSTHIKTCNKLFSVIPIFKLHTNSDYIRKKMEDNFIFLLKPELNSNM